MSPGSISTSSDLGRDEVLYVGSERSGGDEFLDGIRGITIVLVQV